MDIAKDIGTQLKRIREWRGLNQLELSERAGLTRVTVHRVEHGMHPPSIETLVKLARALEVPLISLLPEDQFPKAEAPYHSGQDELHHRKEDLHSGHDPHSREEIEGLRARLREVEEALVRLERGRAAHE